MTVPGPILTRHRVLARPDVFPVTRAGKDGPYGRSSLPRLKHRGPVVGNHYLVFRVVRLDNDLLISFL